MTDVQLIFVCLDDVHDGQLTINSESNDNELRVTVVEPASIPNEYEDNRRDLYLYKVRTINAAHKNISSACYIDFWST